MSIFQDFATFLVIFHKILGLGGARAQVRGRTAKKQQPTHCHHIHTCRDEEVPLLPLLDSLQGYTERIMVVGTLKMEEGKQKQVKEAKMESARGNDTNDSRSVVPQLSTILVNETPLFPEATTTTNERKDKGAGLELLEDFESADLGSATANGTHESPSSKSVHPKRKEELLLQARADRLQWIQKVSLPYRPTSDSQKTDPWSQDDRLVHFVSSHAAKQLPTTLPLLSELYGVSSTASSPIADRIQAVIGGDVSSMDGVKSKALPSGGQLLKEELLKHENSEDDVTISALKAYHDFWKQLQDPACAMLVQGMRNFCQNLCTLQSSEEIISKLNSYLESTAATLTAHAAFKDRQDYEEQQLKRSLESFIYGHINAHLETVLWNAQTKAQDKEWLDRLECLQFVTAAHLEISCLHDDMDLLSASCQAVLSVDQQYSPFEKLQRILEVYRTVNAALSYALNKASTGKEQPKLPSADDVLPTMILVLLKAKPSRLLWNLERIEQESPPAYLRGEAGYAYTNLYGAVHFLQDLNSGEKLSMSPQDFQKSLAESRRRQAEELETLTKAATAIVDEPVSATTYTPVTIPPHVIREARGRGERIDLEWARQRAESAVTSSQLQQPDQEVQLSAFDEAAQGLPPGFSRNYTFLNASPEDIRLSDLPQLLADYRMLVHATESLIGDRVAKITAARREAAAEAKQDLFERVRQVDPSLLPPNNGGKWRKQQQPNSSSSAAE